MVEQRTENPRVISSILILGTKLIGGSSSAVEHLLAKERVASSNLVFRSTKPAEVAEWYTRQSQKLLRGNSHVGSSPTFGTR